MKIVTIFIFCCLTNLFPDVKLFIRIFNNKKRKFYEKRCFVFYVQILCGVLATDANSIMIGTPVLPFPLPYTSLNIAIPEIPVFKKITRSGYGRFAFNILKAADRAPEKVISGIEASSSYTNWTILLIPFKSHDMPLKIREGSKTTFSVDSGNI